MTSTGLLPSPGIALRITHPTRDAAFVSDAVGLTATHVRPLGMPGREARYHSWLHGTRARAEETTEEDIAEFLRNLLPQRDALLDLRASGGQIDLWLTWSAGHPNGFELPFETIQLLAELGCGLMLEAFAGATGQQEQPA